MSDPLKQFSALARARADAMIADLAAKAMAQHFDALLGELTKTVERDEVDRVLADNRESGMALALDRFLEARKEKALQAASAAMMKADS